jgi:hypothetical protein
MESMSRTVRAIAGARTGGGAAVIEHPRSRNGYMRRTQDKVFHAVLRLRAAGYRVYRDDDKHKVWFPRAGKMSFLSDAELVRLADA